MGIWHKRPLNSATEVSSFDNEPAIFPFAHPEYSKNNVRMGVIKDDDSTGSTFFRKENFLIVNDGVIENRSELSKNLKLSSNSSEGEVVLALYRRDGMEGLFKLEGTISIIIYDLAQNTSILYRGLLKSNLLYYSIANNQLTVSTNPLFLLCGNDAEDFISFEKMSSVFLLRPDYLPVTVFKDISTVKHGEIIVITSGNIQKHTQPLNEIFHTGVHYHSEKEAIEGYLHLLEAAVAKTIQPNKQYGIMLSSGIDSSSIAVLAARILRESGRTLKAISWTLPNDKLGDESQKIQELCSMHDIPLTLFDGEKYGPFDALDDLFFLSGSPFINPFWLISAEAYRVAAQNGVTKLFNGGYADLLFPYRSNLLIDTIKDNRFDLLLPFIVDSVRHHGWMRLYKAPELRRLISILLPGRQRRKQYPAGLEWMTEEAKNSLPASQPDYLQDPEFARLRHAFTPIQTDILGAYRNLPGQFGIERIEPHRDLELIEYAVKIPSYMAFRNNQIKYYVREAMRGLLPESIRTQPLVGKLSPFVSRSFHRNKKKAREMIFDNTQAWNRYVREEWMVQKFQDDTVLTSQDMLIIWISLYIAPWQKAIKPGGTLCPNKLIQDRPIAE